MLCASSSPRSPRVGALRAAECGRPPTTLIARSHRPSFLISPSDTVAVASHGLHRCFTWFSSPSNTHPPPRFHTLQHACLAVRPDVSTKQRSPPASPGLPAPPPHRTKQPTWPSRPSPSPTHARSRVPPAATQKTTCFDFPARRNRRTKLGTQLGGGIDGQGNVCQVAERLSLGEYSFSCFHSLLLVRPLRRGVSHALW